MNKRTTCRHCGKRPSNRPRNLCEPCYRKPDIRKNYPFHERYAGRGVECANGPSKLPAYPVPYRPGSEAKMRAMHFRILRGEGLFHPADGRKGTPMITLSVSCEQRHDPEFDGYAFELSEPMTGFRAAVTIEAGDGVLRLDFDSIEALDLLAAATTSARRQLDELRKAELARAAS